MECAMTFLLVSTSVAFTRILHRDGQKKSFKSYLCTQLLDGFTSLDEGNKPKLNKG